jgi:hypothetical protein
MNRALPPGDRGDRSSDPRRPHGHRWLVLGAIGLVGEASDPAERRTPPEVKPAARTNVDWSGSALNRVAVLAVLALDRRDGQPHLLADCARQDAPNGMRLPVGGFHEFLHRGAARAFQQVEDLSRLAAASGGPFLSAFGRFLGGAGLLPRLALVLRNVGALWRTTGLFGGFLLLR